jgi:predicted Rossmann fold nucleotide-binding protein DprA/Smf involved in DNA uptake
LFEEAALGGSGHLSPPNYQGKDLVLKQGATWSNTQSHMLESLSASTSNRSDRPTSERFMQQSCQHLQQQICAQLAHQVGVNSLYAQALERFGTQRLQDAWRTLTSQLSGQMHSGTANQQQHRQQNVREHLPAVRQESATSIVQHADAPLLPLQQQQQQQQPPLQQLRRQSDYGPSSCLILRPQQPAEIACLALQLPQGKLSLHLTGERWQQQAPPSRLLMVAGL